MALVAFLKGVNVGGHRTFRPSVLAKELEHLDVVNVGSAGTFVVRNPIGRRDLQAEIARRVPFEVDVMICGGSDVLRLAAEDPFALHAPDGGIVQFVSVMAERGEPLSALPLTLPPEGRWTLRVLACQDQFVLGLYRREMKAIGYLGQLERLVGAPLATRGWSTYRTIVRILTS